MGPAVHGLRGRRSGAQPEPAPLQPAVPEHPSFIGGSQQAKARVDAQSSEAAGVLVGPVAENIPMDSRSQLRTTGSDGRWPQPNQVVRLKGRDLRIGAVPQQQNIFRRFRLCLAVTGTASIWFVACTRLRPQFRSQSAAPACTSLCTDD